MELLAAFGTRERFHARVRVHVQAQRRFAAIRFAAHAALDRLAVHPFDVLLERVLVRVHDPALAALDCAVVGDVRAHVHAQREGRHERAAADLAQERFRHVPQHMRQDGAPVVATAIAGSGSE